MVNTESSVVDELLGLAESVAIQAGEYALQQRRGAVSVADTKLNDVDIVTIVDRDTEAMIRELIRRERPNDGFFGEEGNSSTSESGITWVVDPIDGTVNYLYDRPHWAVSIAVVEGSRDPQHWQTLVGVVNNPSTGELFSATMAGPATMNGRPISVNPDTTFGHALIGTGFAYNHDVRARQGQLVGELLGVARDVRRGGSASLDLVDVAIGRLDGYFEANTAPWDHAAGVLIAERAGARVSGWPGERPDRRLVVAAAPAIFDELLAFASRTDVTGG